LNDDRVLDPRMFGSTMNALDWYYKMDDGTRIQVVGIVEDGKYSPNITEELRPAMFLVGPHLGYAKLQNRRAFWDIAGARVA